VFTVLKIEIVVKYTVKMQLNTVKNYIVFKHLCFYYSSCEESFGIRRLMCYVYTTNEYVDNKLF